MEITVEQFVAMQWSGIYWGGEMWREANDQYRNLPHLGKVIVDNSLREAGVNPDIMNYCMLPKYSPVQFIGEVRTAFRVMQELFDEVYHLGDMIDVLEDLIFMIGEASLTIDRMQMTMSKMVELGAVINSGGVWASITKEVFNS